MDGADPLAVERQHRLHLISISPVNHPPIAISGSANVGLDATVLGTFSALDTDCPPVVLTFRVVADALKGVVSLINTNTGEFLYQPAPDAIGPDLFLFVAGDDTLDSTPTTFTVTIWPNLDPGDIIVSDNRNKTVDPSSLTALRHRQAVSR